MAHRFPGRPPGLSPLVLPGTQDERQAENTSRKDKPKDKTNPKLPGPKNKPKDKPNLKLPGGMSTAHPFPGRPPGSDDDSFSSVVSSIHDYIDGTEAFLGFEDADHFHRLASEFFDDDDSFWSIHHHLQQEQQHHPQTAAPTMTCLSGRPPGPFDLHCLVPSQVYKAQTSRRDSTFKPSAVPHTVQFDYYNPTASDPLGLRKDIYSKNDIRHYFGLVSDSIDLNPLSVPTTYPSPAIPKTKSWRMPVPTSDNIALHAAYDPVEYAAACLQCASFFGLDTQENPNTDAHIGASPAPVFRTSSAPKAASLLEPSFSEDTCTTTTTTSTLCGDLAGTHSGIGFGNSFVTLTTKPEEEIIFESQDSDDSTLFVLHYLATLHSFWIPFVFRRLSPFWGFQPAQKVYLQRRTGSLFRWVLALLHKLLLVAWDLWQYKID